MFQIFSLLQMLLTVLHYAQSYMSFSDLTKNVHSILYEAFKYVAS